MTQKEADTMSNQNNIGDRNESMPKTEGPMRTPKHGKIEAAIETSNVVGLRALALDKGGLLEDSLRRQAWPILLGIDEKTSLNKPTEDEIKNHKYYEQVLLDVNRSIKRFPPSIPSESRLNLQDKLVAVIMRVLVANPLLHYYQGYHDICVTILLVVDGDEDLAFRIVDKVSRTKLHVYMEASMQATARQLELVYTLLDTQDSALRDFLERSECGIMFCLSWCITWFGHDLDHYPSLIRLYDLLLATDDTPHLMPVYLTASLVLSHSRALQLEECSMAGVHSYLSKIPNTLDHESSELEERVKFARKLFAEFSYEQLKTIQADRLRREEQDRQWRASYLGITLMRLRSVPWNKRIIGTVIIVAVAIAYQTFRRQAVQSIEL